MLMKKMAVIALTAAITFSMAAHAFAHDGWSQTNAPIMAQGEVSYVELLFGNHSNEHKSYRIAGQWSPDTSKVYVTTPAGKKVDITATRYYTGEAATDKEPAVNNGFVATFTSSAPGAYIVTAEADSINKTAASRSLRSAKSFVAVSDIPTLDRVKALRGFSKPVNLDRAEFVPLFNPAAVTPNERVAVQLLMKGKPVESTKVSLIRRSNSEAQTFQTDANGLITFQTGLADDYLLRASISTDEGKEGEYTKVTYSRTMTYRVQNGSVSLHAGPVNPNPHVFVNGKLIEANDIFIQNDVTYVNASFLQEHMDKAYTNEGLVALRTAAESLGAIVEYLPAVGESRAAVLIYTKP